MEIELFVTHALVSRENRNAIDRSQAIMPGETIGSLFQRLEQSNPDAWRNIWNVDDERLQGHILVTLNNRGIRDTNMFHTTLQDGDRITVRGILAGG